MATHSTVTFSGSKAHAIVTPAEIDALIHGEVPPAMADRLASYSLHSRSTITAPANHTTR